MGGNALFEFDRGLGRRFTAGADEAGRGCLAGPLVAAGVLLDQDRLTDQHYESLIDLDDSKKHTPAQREILYEAVLQAASRISVVVRTAAEIDRAGLHVTNLAALGTALDRVGHPDGICLSDGFAVRGLEMENMPVVRGDATSAAIAAASIIAKVTRDRFMRRMAGTHELWAFEEHLGYSTPEHRRRIETHGLSPIHRRSFKSVAYQQLELEAWA